MERTMRQGAGGSGCCVLLNPILPARCADPGYKRLKEPPWGRKLGGLDSPLFTLGPQMGSRDLGAGAGSERLRTMGRDVCGVERSYKEGSLLAALDIMDQQGSVPSVQVYKDLLQACMKNKDLVQAKQVHAHMERHGLESHRYLGDLVVTTLVNCGRLEDGLPLFQKLSHRTVYSWTAIISGYSNAGQCAEAFLCYEQMLQEGVQPNNHTLASLLKACSRLGDLEQGKRIHADVLRLGFESDMFVTNTLLSMYAKCGSIINARQVFDRLSDRNVVSWNAMLAAYAQQDQGEKALELYAEMRAQGVKPTARTFVSVVQACGNLADKEESRLDRGRQLKVDSLERGKEMHVEAVQWGCESDPFLGNSLVCMYAKCGSISDAQEAFNKMSQRNEVSWNALLDAYAQQDKGEKVLQIYALMQDEGIRPEARTFVIVLQACSTLAEKEKGTMDGGNNVKVETLRVVKEIHSETARSGYETDLFVANTLLTAYAKCGSTALARQVFERLPHHDVVSWTAMIAAYVEQGQGEKGLQMYAKMQQQGIRPDARVFVSALQACSTFAEQEESAPVDGNNLKVEALWRGKEIHGEAAARGFDSDMFVASALISMYAKCGSIINAEWVFHRLSRVNSVPWNTMLAAYAQNDQCKKALWVFSQMQEEGIKLEARTFVSALQACSTLAENEESLLVDGQSLKVESLRTGKAVHGNAMDAGFKSDIFVGSTLVRMYAKCGSLYDARHVFDRLLQRDVVSWNAMIAAYAQQNQGEKALQLYGEMMEDGVTPEARTLVCALQACNTLADKEEGSFVRGKRVKENSLQKGKEIHVDAARQGFETDFFVGSTLVSMYAKCGSVEEAWHVFEGLPDRHVVSWNAMIAAYAQEDQGEKALQVYGQMQEEGVIPDEATFLSVLEACGSIGALHSCVLAHQSLVQRGLQTQRVIANSLIHVYGKCGSMMDAQYVFDSLSDPDVVSWTSLIAGHSRQGDHEKSILLYGNMKDAGVRPNQVTFLALLSACSHAGMVERGLQYFESMTRDYGIPAELEHYVCMIDLLGRAGRLSEAEDLLSRMPMQPTLPVWLSLLGACRKHSLVELARRAFDGAVVLEPGKAAAYGLMSNIYADAGMWDHVKEIDALRQKAGAWKKPGQSWLEHEQKVYTFFVEDRRHEQEAHLYALLGQLKSEMEGAGKCVSPSVE